jgi:hypothetical protein
MVLTALMTVRELADDYEVIVVNDGGYRQGRGKLGWCPDVLLEEGLRRTLAYYEYGQHY